MSRLLVILGASACCLPAWNMWENKNQSVMSYLSDYVSMTARQFEGDVIAVFGFDEPAGRFLEHSDTARDWVLMVADYRSQCESQIGLPFISFISKYGTSGPDGSMEYYSDTTGVLNRFSRHLGVIALNMYPIRNNDRRLRNIPFGTENVLFHGMPSTTVPCWNSNPT